MNSNLFLNDLQGSQERCNYGNCKTVLAVSLLSQN
jgi:hypothetical protein